MKGTDVPIRWTGGAGGDVSFRGEATPSGKVIILSCSFAGGASEGVVRGSLLSNVPTGASFSISGETKTVAAATVADWSVELYASHRTSGDVQTSFTLTIGN
jgi:hypothetical protein